MAFDIDQRFFRHTSADKRSEIRVKPEFDYDIQGLKRGEVLPSDPFPVKIDEGKKFYDILWLQDVFNFTVADRIHTALVEAGITGFKSYPILIEGREEQYWGIQVTGRAGPPIYPAEKGFTVGLHFDLDKWDGSDMFILPPTMFTIFSQRLRDLLVKLKTTNLALEDTATMEWYSS